jgi:hypothetical protein
MRQDYPDAPSPVGIFFTIDEQLEISSWLD